MKAFASLFLSLNKKSQQKYYGLVADILNILPPLKTSGDSEELSQALLALIELAEVAPRMFKSQFSGLVTFSISVIQDKELGDTARQNALELMAGFADSNPAMCRKDPTYTSEMVTQCLSLMTDVGIDDDNAEEWAATEDVSILSMISAISDQDSLISMKAMPIMLRESKRSTGLPTNLAGQLFYHQLSIGCLR